MRFIDNSRGTQQSAPSAGSVRHQLSHNVVISPIHPISGPCLRFLIANLELEFNLTPIRINDLKFSNRKFSVIFYVAFQPPRLAFPHRRFRPRASRAGAPSLQNLIETPRLEFSATPTKQSSLSISNRGKIALLAPQTPSMVGIPVPLW